MQHIEQLLRTLNLNSPDSFVQQKPAPNLSFEAAPPGSPDFSPASVSSALLTPTNLSPTRSFDIKQLQSPYELATGLHSGSYIPQTSLLFKPSSRTRVHHISDNGALSHSPTFNSSQMPISDVPYLHAPSQLHSLPYYMKSYDHHPAAAAGITPHPSYSPPMSYRQETANNVGISHGPICSSDLHVPQPSVQPTLDLFSDMLTVHILMQRRWSILLASVLEVSVLMSIPLEVIHHLHTNSRLHPHPQGQSSHEVCTQ
ncbi:hypothetical protein EDD18DRAFT_1435972 [Armillaria luteobubalina]|uniref:Uncharacterized protein n=1 Tax=Armillaria luteobubalina TaxID=153913 RepID=A0AA39PD17_9AGAR|nr:hypothetical protein EDD18DRAFT_1435972 [Armillaria luteobubalina]